MDPFTWSSKDTGRPARIYIQQLCVDTGCSPEDQPEAMDDRLGWRERAGISVLIARHDDDDDDGLFKSLSTKYSFTNHVWYIYKHDLLSKNLQRLTCQKIQLINQPTISYFLCSYSSSCCSCFCCCWRCLFLFLHSLFNLKFTSLPSL